MTTPSPQLCTLGAADMGILRKDDASMKDWVYEVLEEAEKRRYVPYQHRIIQEFRDLIEQEDDVLEGFTQMFDELSDPGPVDDYEKMLAVFDVIIGQAPIFRNLSQVAFPICAVLAGPMGTRAGFRMFSDARVNAVIKKMLDTWFQFLSSPRSRYVLSDGPTGWFGPAAVAAMPNFAQTFVCDPMAPYYGFKSWEDFFIRRFRPGIRPIDSPTDDTIINSACEATPFRIEYSVSETHRFLLKGYPYSILRMLNNDELAPHFVGGTVYQGFLHQFFYHRWHSPVNGRVVKTVIVPGAYYLYIPCSEGEEIPPDGVPVLDDRAITGSQDFLAQVATRCLIFIEADNPAIGLMCFMGIGMEEVSTCQPTVVPGQRVRKGDEIGMFHFGGSTHCLVFRKDTPVSFFCGSSLGQRIPVNAAIGRVG
ncbi:hypothetical protein EIP91_003773 [Steccherinum ochraceum]|uniref:L-tryptophan decarboxylase PsiD-like domain-containing protein n=1 Tax=Steccherinum ochraceum TaxID=92696 RepID=A0A4R0RIF9_9APHY|nr:hypothetical protein EIP91_003773 [Steccherinum ochraceum]